MRLRFFALLCLAGGCEVQKPPETGAAPTVNVEPLAMGTTAMAASAPVDTALPLPSATPSAAPASSTFTWVTTGSSKVGNVILRCEGTPEHPSEVAGGCLCNSTILNPCEGEARPQHMVDRRQCGFDCSVAANKVRLQCPDGVLPKKAAAGCSCGTAKERTLAPCGSGKPKSIEVKDKTCIVTC